MCFLKSDVYFFYYNNSSLTCRRISSYVFNNLNFNVFTHYLSLPLFVRVVHLCNGTFQKHKYTVIP